MGKMNLATSVYGKIGHMYSEIGEAYVLLDNGKVEDARDKVTTSHNNFRALSIGENIDPRIRGCIDRSVVEFYNEARRVSR